MIKFLKNEEIDLDKWDACISKSFNSIPYAYAWFLDLIHEEWAALVEGDYERVMPVTGGKKFGIRYVYQPYFAQQLGVFSTSLLNPEVVNKFINAIPFDYKYIDIKLNSFNQPDLENAEVIPNKNHLLDLIQDYERIAENYSGQTKKNLKKSLKSELSMMKHIKPESVIDLFREHRGKTLKKWNDTHYNKLKHLMYSSIHKGRGVVYGVFNNYNELSAGAFFLKSKKRMIFLFSGTSNIGRENAAMTFLIDGVIREYAPAHTVLDFEGSNDPNLARFYKGFGAKEIEYPGLRMNRLTFPARQLFGFYKKVKKQ
jgi:disulfide oxidoreductase YuzD